MKAYVIFYSIKVQPEESLVIEFKEHDWQDLPFGTFPLGLIAAENKPACIHLIEKMIMGAFVRTAPNLN